MKTITYEDFVSFNPCWLTDDEERDEHADQLAGYRAMRDEWSALDILRLDEVDAEDRLWLVLREELIDAPILHEFACRCADRALARIEMPDSISVEAIEAKRKWMRGEISEEAMAAERAAAGAAEMIAERAEEFVAAKAAAWAAERAASMDAAWTAEREWQVAELMRMLEAQE